MKAFMAGLLAGVALYAMGDALYVRHQASPPARRIETPVAASMPQATKPAVETPAALTSVPSPSPADPGAGCIPMDDAAIEKAAMDVHLRREQRKQEERDAEPKDPAWSTQTEQQIQQFIVRHRLGKRFLVTDVDCRTLFCEIKAEGTAVQSQGEDNPVIAFQKVMEDLHKQLDLMTGEMGSGSSDGISTTMYIRLRRFSRPPCPPGFPEDCYNR